jgi:hypothetical protein
MTDDVISDDELREMVEDPHCTVMCAKCAKSIPRERQIYHLIGAPPMFASEVEDTQRPRCVSCGRPLPPPLDN